MSHHDTEPIQSVAVSAFRIPTEEPESDGTLEWDATTLVAVEVERVAAARDAIGPEPELMVDANGAYDRRLDAAVLCRARSLPLSSHCAPALHAHPACAAQPVRHVEHFHDHARIEAMAFDGALSAAGGTLRPDRSRPGLGLELKTADLEPCRVYHREVRDG